MSNDEFYDGLHYAFLIAMTTFSIVMSCREAKAEVFEVRNLSFTGGKYTSPANVRDSYLNTPKDFQLIARIQLDWDVDLICSESDLYCMFWNNNVQGKSAEAAFKYVHWESETGVSFKYLDVGYYHQSQHILEEERPQKAYPIEDMVFIRLKFISNPRRVQHAGM